MRRRLRGTAGAPVRRDTAITVAGGFWAQATVLVSGVLVARILGVENRGHLALLWIVALVLGQLGSLGLPLATTYWIAKRRVSARAIVRSLAWPAAVQTVVLVSLQALALELILGDEVRPVRVAALFTLGAVPAMLAQQYALAILQGQQRFRAFNIVRILPATSYSVAVVTLFLVSSSDLPTVALAWTSSYMLAAGVALGYALSGLPDDSAAPSRPPDRAEMLRFGMTGLLGSASPVDTFQLDQAVVGLFISPSALGLYVVAVAFTNLPRVLAQNIGYVAYPHVAECPTPQAARRAMWRFAAVALLGLGFTVAALEVTADRLVSFFFGTEFSGSAGLARILLVGALLAGVRRVLADGARGAGRPGLGTLGEVASWVCLILTLPVLVPAAGVTGVALSLVTSSAVSLAVLVAAIAVAGRRAPPRPAMASQPDLAKEMPG